MDPLSYKNNNSHADLATIFALILIVVVHYHFWGYYLFASIPKVWTAIDLMLFAAICVYGLRVFYKTDAPIIKWIFINTILSMSVAVIYWEQPLISTIRLYINPLLIVVFFCLVRYKANPKDVQTALFILAVLYFICWIYQSLSVPQFIFGIDRDVDFPNDTRGFFRFWIPTKEHFPFLLFFFISLFINFKKKYAIPLAGVVFLVIILHVGRQMMFWSFLSSIFYLLYSYRTKWFSMIAASCLVYGITVYAIDNVKVLNNVFEMTDDQLSDVSGDIRVEAINHFTYDYSPNLITTLVGTGLPTKDSDLFRKTEEDTSRGYFKSDVGFWGLFADYGIFGVILYLALFVKIMRMKVESRYSYLKFYFIYIYGSFLFAHALTTNIFFNTCAYYILYTSNRSLRLGKRRATLIQSKN